MGGIRNVLDGGVGQPCVITKSDESGDVAEAPTAPANVQIVDKERSQPKVHSLKRRKNLVGKWNQSTLRLNFSYVRQRSRRIRARPPQAQRTFLAMNDENYYAGHSSMALACSNFTQCPRVPTTYLPGGELVRGENAKLCSALEHERLWERCGLLCPLGTL